MSPFQVKRVDRYLRICLVVKMLDLNLNWKLMFEIVKIFCTDNISVEEVEEQWLFKMPSEEFRFQYG